jgi:hypothetical protein
MVSSLRLVPILVGITPLEVRFPLAQFQMTSLIKDDFLKFIKSLNKSIAIPLSDDVLTTTFDYCWHMIEAIGNSIEVSAGKDNMEGAVSATDFGQTVILERLGGILSVFRGMENFLSDPRKILLEDYLSSLFRILCIQT